MVELADRIEKYCNEKGIVYGICDNSPLEVCRYNPLDKIPFVPYGLDLRINPALSLPSVKSVIVVGVPVDVNGYKALDGIIAASMAGKDYHRTVGDILLDIAGIVTEGASCKCTVQVDSGPLNERGYAIKSGIGFAGRNMNIINSLFGSFFNIGLVLSSAEIKQKTDNHVNGGKCAGCGLCIKSCPSGALSEKGFDYSLCRSYLTQKKGVLKKTEMSLMGISIYGCDICRNACPYNNEAAISQADNPNDIANKLTGLLNLSKKEFDKLYRDSNFYWRGKTVISRNALISLSKVEGGRDLVSAYARSENIVLRETAKACLDLN